MKWMFMAEDGSIGDGEDEETVESVANSVWAQFATREAIAAEASTTMISPEEDEEETDEGCGPMEIKLLYADDGYASLWLTFWGEENGGSVHAESQTLEGNTWDDYGSAELTSFKACEEFVRHAWNAYFAPDEESDDDEDED